MNDILDKKLAIQDNLISFLEVSIELKKLVSDFEKDMEKEMLNDQKKNIKV